MTSAILLIGIKPPSFIHTRFSCPSDSSDWHPITISFDPSSEDDPSNSTGDHTSLCIFSIFRQLACQTQTGNEWMGSSSQKMGGIEPCLSEICFADVKCQVAQEEHEKITKGDLIMNFKGLSPAKFILVALNLENIQYVHILLCATNHDTDEKAGNTSWCKNFSHTHSGNNTPMQANKPPGTNAGFYFCA